MSAQNKRKIKIVIKSPIRFLKNHSEDDDITAIRGRKPVKSRTVYFDATRGKLMMSRPHYRHRVPTKAEDADFNEIAEIVTWETINSQDFDNLGVEY